MVHHFIYLIMYVHRIKMKVKLALFSLLIAITGALQAMQMEMFEHYATVEAQVAKKERASIVDAITKGDLTSGERIPLLDVILYDFGEEAAIDQVINQDPASVNQQFHIGYNLLYWTALLGEEPLFAFILKRVDRVPLNCPYLDLGSMRTSYPK